MKWMYSHAYTAPATSRLSVSTILDLIMSACLFKSSWLLFFLVTTNCLLSVQSQKLFLGGCPSVNIMQTFDVTQYLGGWYENRKYFAIFEFGQRCIKATYTDKGNGLIGVNNSGTKILFGTPVSIDGVAAQVNPPTGELGVSFANIDTAPTNSNYWVLGTDYTTYSIVWSCSNFALFNTQFLWILTRDREPSADVITSALAVIEANGLNKNWLRITDQTNCSN